MVACWIMANFLPSIVIMGVMTRISSKAGSNPRASSPVASIRVDARSISLIGREHVAARRHTWALKALHEVPGLVMVRFPAIGLWVRLAPICQSAGVTICRVFVRGRAGHARVFHVSYGP